MRPVTICNCGNLSGEFFIPSAAPGRAHGDPAARLKEKPLLNEERLWKGSSDQVVSLTADFCFCLSGERGRKITLTGRAGDPERPDATSVLWTGGSDSAPPNLHADRNE